MNISCRKIKCKHNQNYACQSRAIKIREDLNCDFYEPIEKEDLQDVSKTMFEIAPEIAPFRHNKEAKIKCDADCIFNKAHKCCSNGIFVNGESKRPNIVQNQESDYLCDCGCQERGEESVCKSKNCKSKKNRGEALCFSFVKK